MAQYRSNIMDRWSLDWIDVFYLLEVAIEPFWQVLDMSANIIMAHSSGILRKNYYCVLCTLIANGAIWLVAPHSRVWDNSLCTMLPDPFFACVLGGWVTRLVTHLPLLEQSSVQSKMLKFHAHCAALEMPTCTTCCKQFPGLKVNIILHIHCYLQFSLLLWLYIYHAHYYSLSSILIISK